MKVGDLVVRRNDLVREAVGEGIVVDTQEQPGLPTLFYQVQWFRYQAPSWYDGPELEVISESR
jgi:hypothetical protein